MKTAIREASIKDESKRLKHIDNIENIRTRENVLELLKFHQTYREKNHRLQPEFPDAFIRAINIFNEITLDGKSLDFFFHHFLSELLSCYSYHFTRDQVQKIYERKWDIIIEINDMITGWSPWGAFEDAYIDKDKYKVHDDGDVDFPDVDEAHERFQNELDQIKMQIDIMSCFKD